MKAYYLFMVLLWSLGIMFYSKEAQSAISPNHIAPLTWHTEEIFHAHESAIQVNTSNNAEEEDDEEHDEDEFNVKCVFSKKEIQFNSVHFKECLISVHPKSRLLKPYLKTQFTPPDLMLIA
jgi:hypothetical protein